MDNSPNKLEAPCWINATNTFILSIFQRMKHNNPFVLPDSEPAEPEKKRKEVEPQEKKSKNKYKDKKGKHPNYNRQCATIEHDDYVI